MTTQAVGEQGCSARRADLQLCRAKVLAGTNPPLCAFHARVAADPEAARQAGKKGAEAKKRAKQRKAAGDSWSAKVASWFDRAGDADVDRIMGTAQGAAAAMRLAEAELEREREREHADSPVGQFGGTTLAQVVALAYEIGSARLVGLPELTDTQLEELRTRARSRAARASASSSSATFEGSSWHALD